MFKMKIVEIIHHIEMYSTILGVYTTSALIYIISGSLYHP
jgi:hypothetical protein